MFWVAPALSVGQEGRQFTSGPETGSIVTCPSRGKLPFEVRLVWRNEAGHIPTIANGPSTEQSQVRSMCTISNRTFVNDMP